MRNIILQKMSSEHASPIKYFLKTPDGKTEMSALIGKRIKIAYTGNIFCIKCGRKTTKSFGQGFCYPCFTNAPENEPCVLRPELCQAHLGIARDMEYAKEHCLSDQVVYLASSETIKVGVTRVSQVPYRWIDQGASFATIIAIVPNRYTAGLLEVELKKHLPDKTNWRAMLTNTVDANPDFQSVIEKIKQVLPDELKAYLVENQKIESFTYPVNAYPKKINSIDLEKEQIIEDELEGIKGQYLIFSNGRVINVRKYSGYEVKLEME